MLALVDLLEQVRGVLDDHVTAIAGVLGRHPNAALFASFPGTGSITTATLLAEIGEDRSRFLAPGSLLAEAGLAPVTRRSGSSRPVGFRYASNDHGRLPWGLRPPALEVVCTDCAASRVAPSFAVRCRPAAHPKSSSGYAGSAVPGDVLASRFGSRSQLPYCHHPHGRLVPGQAAAEAVRGVGRRAPPQRGSSKHGPVSTSGGSAPDPELAPLRLAPRARSRPCAPPTSRLEPSRASASRGSTPGRWRPLPVLCRRWRYRRAQRR